MLRHTSRIFQPRPPSPSAPSSIPDPEPGQEATSARSSKRISRIPSFNFSALKRHRLSSKAPPSSADALSSAHPGNAVPKPALLASRSVPSLASSFVGSKKAVPPAEALVPAGFPETPPVSVVRQPRQEQEEQKLRRSLSTQTRFFSNPANVRRLGRPAGASLGPATQIQSQSKPERETRVGITMAERTSLPRSRTMASLAGESRIDETHKSGLSSSVSVPDLMLNAGQVAEAQPLSYWAGRFTALSDRFLMEDFTVDAEEQDPLADAIRIQRVFLRLSCYCETDEALRSFEAFQEAYSKKHPMANVRLPETKRSDRSLIERLFGRRSGS